MPIDIISTSETALLAVSCLPSGLQEKYAASDTTLRIARVYASTATPAGTSTPAMTVNSVGQTASTNFTLVGTE